MKTHIHLLLGLMFLLGFGNFIFAQEILPKASVNTQAKFIFEHTDIFPLYEQVDNPDTVGTNSQEYMDFPTYSCQAADDFIIPAGQTWQVNEINVPGFYSFEGGPVDLVNFFLYQNNPETNSPGEELLILPQLQINPSPDGNLMLVFSDPLVLGEGHYWLSVQPIMPFGELGQWFWWQQLSPTLNEEYHWRNPGGGFEVPNTSDWLTASEVIFDSPILNFNLSFAIFGTILGGNPPQNMSLRVGDYHNPEQWHNWIGGENEITHVQLFADDPDHQILSVSFSWSMDGDLWNSFYSDFDGATANENSTNPSDPLVDGWSGYLPHIIFPQIEIELFVRAEVLTSEGGIIDVSYTTHYDPSPPSGLLFNIEDFMTITDDVLLLDIDPGSCTDLFEVEIELVAKPEEFNKGIPGISQPTNVTCAPTAAAACLKWFEGQGDTEVTGGASNSALIDSLKKYCGTTATGTQVPDLVNGIKKWLEGHGDGYSVRGPLDFDWEEMRNELEKGQNVLSGIYGANVAHRMTFNSIKNRPEEDGKIRVDFMDPWTGEEEWGYLDTETGELTGFSSSLLNSGTLKKIIIICPKEATALPGTGTVLPGPDPPPLSIPIPNSGLYFLRINALDQSGNAASYDFVINKQDDQYLPSEGGHLTIGDWNIAEDWHNWIGGEGQSTQLHLLGYSDYPVEQVTFSVLSNDNWVDFFTDTDGQEQRETTTGTDPDEGDGWMGLFAHELISQVNQDLFFKADILLGNGQVISEINSIKYDATPANEYLINIPDFMETDQDHILLEIDPGNVNIQSVEIELVLKPEEFNKGVPGITQPTGTTCAPTAAAACLKWFEGQGDTEITGGLTNGALIDSLKKYCKTDIGGAGTTPSDLANGIKKWIEGNGDGYTIRGPLDFDWEEMRNELERGQDVLSGIAWTGGGGHRMTFNSIKNRAEEDGKIRVDFMDPWTGQEEWGYLDTETGQLTGFSSTAGNSGKLKGIIIICPKETTALPGTGTVLPGPNPPPLSIPIPDVGLHFLRINVLDQDGNTSRRDVVVDRIAAPLQQTVEIAAGWSGISSYLVPTDLSFGSIFGDIENDLTILYNFNGFYWPGENVNTLVEWNPNSGYAIKMASETVLTFVGESNPDTDVTLNASVSLLHIPTECGISTFELLLALGDNLIMVQEVATDKVFLPGYGIDQILHLIPGKAYFVAIVNPPAVISFPECGVVTMPQTKNQEVEINSPWGKVKNTPLSHQVIFTDEALNVLNDNDLIGVFDQHGTLVGLTRTETGGSFSVSAFADDQYTESKDGMISGETIEFRVYKADQEISYRLLPEFDPGLPHQGDFTHFGLSGVNSFKLEPISVDEINETGLRIYPNPSQGRFTIEQYMKLQFDHFEIIEAGGRKILSGNLQAKTEVDLGSYEKGIYFIRLIGQHKTDLRKMVLR